MHAYDIEVSNSGEGIRLEIPDAATAISAGITINLQGVKSAPIQLNIWTDWLVTQQRHTAALSVCHGLH